jgi:hypothetical protein
MLDMINVGLRTLMCIGFILFVVRPMLMSMFRRETDRVGIEQAAQFAVMSAFKHQFDRLLNAPPPTTITVEPLIQEEILPEPAPSTDPVIAPSAKPNPFIRAGVTRPKRVKESDEVEIILDEEPSEEESELDAMKKRMKEQKKKSKPTIPAELLSNANSFDDQLMVARYVVEHEKARVASVIKSMIQI